MKNIMSIIPSKSEIVPFNPQLAKDLETLSKDIARSQKELKVTLNNFKSSSLDVEIEKNFFGCVKKSSIEDSFEKVYSNLGYYIGECGNAIQHTNDNLNRTLELIKLIALAEKELYEQIDFQAVSNNELKTILWDWFKKQGIKDEDIHELIETSFQRAYTLRDRLNSLRQEYRENIAQCINKINTFENRYTKLDYEIAEYIKNTKSELQNALEDNKQTFETLYNKRYSTLDNLANNKEQILREFVENSYKRLETANDKILESLNTIEKTISNINDKENKFNFSAETKFNELSQVKNDAEKEIKEFITEKENGIIETFKSSYKEFFENLTSVSIEAQNKIEEKKLFIEKSIDEAKSLFDNNIQEHNKTLEAIRASLKDEFHNLIKEQNDKFEKEKIALKSSFKKKIIWTIIGSIAISSIVAYFVVTLGI